MTSKFNLFKKGFGPFAPEIYRFPFPNLYRRPAGMSEDSYPRLASLPSRPLLHGPGRPVPRRRRGGRAGSGRGRIRRCSRAPGCDESRELCDQHGMLLIADEIQSGMGRTGKLWAIEHSGVIPDLLTTAKSLAAGMPLSAVVGRSEVMDAPHPGGLGGTYSGNPLACVAALAAIDQISQPDFLARSAELGHEATSSPGPDPDKPPRSDRRRARPRLDAGDGVRPRCRIEGCLGWKQPQRSPRKRSNGA